MLALSDIPAADCRRLLRSTVFGRLALADGAGRIELLTVNYVATEEEFWLRTGPGTVLDRCADGVEVVLQVDQVDLSRGVGWSVVARGSALRAPAGPLTSTGRPAPGPPPWVRRDVEIWFRVPWHEITGRRLGPAMRAGHSTTGDAHGPDAR